MTAQRKTTTNTETAPAGTIAAYLLETARMGDGAGKPDKVIVDGVLMAYVGIGWIRLREATDADYQTYPVAVDTEIGVSR